MVPCWLGSWLSRNFWLVLGQRTQLIFQFIQLDITWTYCLYADDSGNTQLSGWKISWVTCIRTPESSLHLIIPLNCIYIARIVSPVRQLLLEMAVIQIKFGMPARRPVLKNPVTPPHRYSIDGRDTGFLQTRRLVGMSENICNTAISSGRCVAAYTIRVV